MDGGDCDWWIQCPRPQWNQLMPCAFSVSWEWDNRLMGHKSDRQQWKTAVKTRLWDRRATVMTEWGRQDLYQSRRRLNSSWITAMETRLWVFVCFPINNDICFTFAGWESKNQRILTAIGLRGEQEDSIWLLQLWTMTSSNHGKLGGT